MRVRTTPYEVAILLGLNFHLRVTNAFEEQRNILYAFYSDPYLKSLKNNMFM